MELKTLKEIEKNAMTIFQEHNTIKTEIPEIFMNLKQEAIKWVKSCKRRENSTTNNMCGFYYDEEKQHKKPKPVFCEVCQERMKFFNITEEELK